MRTLANTLQKEGSLFEKRRFLNIKQTTRGEWFTKRRYSF